MTQSLFTSLDDLANALGGPPIPEIDTADPRFPYVILVDISGSTGREVNGARDIDKINEAMGHLLQKLKYPPRSGPLAQVHDQIDILIISYATDLTMVLDWTKASELPDQLPLFVASGGTSMGAALLLGLEKVLARQQRYKEQGLPKCGIPHFFNITDGEPTDVKVGDALWLEIEKRLAKAANDPAKRRYVVHNFVAPNGFVVEPGTPKDVDGTPLTGAAQLAKWFGPAGVVGLGEGADNFQNMVEVVVKTITILSQTGAKPEDVAKSGGLDRAA